MTPFDLGADLPSPGYNRQGRGFPDVALLGVSYEVVVGGEIHYVYGSSASAPVFAGMSKSIY